jgi:ADP-ribose pyrophosphatase
MNVSTAAVHEPIAMLPPTWEIQRTHEIYSNGFFRLRRDECSLKRKPSVTTDLFVLEVPDCVSVVPITHDGHIVLIEQYRHGVGDWMLECPGGSIDSDEHDPARAAHRELLEETGYAAGDLIGLGSNPLDPSGQSSRVHTFLARDCRVIADTALEKFEDLKLRLVTRDELANLIRSGANFHTATLASLMLVLANTAFSSI